MPVVRTANTKRPSQPASRARTARHFAASSKASPSGSFVAATPSKLADLQRPALRFLRSNSASPATQVPQPAATGRKRRNHNELTSTDTLDSDIAALANTGDSTRPCAANTPAASGMPSRL